MAGRRHATESGGRAGRWLTLAFGAFALIASGLFVAATLADYRTALGQGHADAETAAALLAEHADRALRIAELTAARVAEMAGREAGALDRVPWEALQALDHAVPEVNSLFLIDAAGRLRASSLDRNAPPVDLSDRPYVRAIAEGAGEAIAGLSLSRVARLWSFGWARAVRGEAGLQGIVYAALHAEPFIRAAERLELGPRAQLRLLRADGTVLLAWPLPAGEPVPREAPRAGAGLVEETGPDGEARLVAWRAAPTMPVVAVAALSRAHVLAPFHRRLLRNGMIFALSLALAGGLALAALRAERREAEARRAAEERGAALAEALAERLRLLASLQEGEARLRLAQQAGGIGLWELDLEARRIALAGEVFAAWGLGGTEGQAFRSLPVRAALRGIDPETRGAVVAAVLGALRGGTPLSVELRLAGRAWPERWVGLRAEPRPGADGRPRRLVGIALDVTAQHRAQQALEEAKETLEARVAERTGALAEANARLREGEARFRGLFNATFQFIGLLSPDGTVLEANAAMLRLGGVTTAGVIGTPYWHAPWWPGDPGTQALVRDAVIEGAGGRFVRRETAMRDAEGREVAVDFSVTPVRDEDGLVSLLVAEARDVSALKAAQALLHEAQKMDTLGQLTGGVAHDFNNLLMVVLGNLAIARKRLERSQPELLRQLDAATQAAERGATLTQRLLAFARRQDLTPKAVDLRALLLGLDALLRRSVGPLVTLAVEAPEGLPPAHVDPHALELALVNLAVNARDAMTEGGRLSVRLALAEGKGPGRLGTGRWLTLAVADTGTGMDAETLSRAVEPFFTTKGPGQGTGLGLSMVHGLAAQSGGALVLESAPGAGTRAVLWLPVSALRPAAAETGREAAPSPGSGAVLVVDDEALVLESTAAMLEELGYDAVPAGSGEAALAVLGARRDIVAVVTDHAMPGMTGAALAARIRQAWPALPVILASGHAGPWPENAELPPRLAKPYSLTQLATALQGVLAKAAE
jgi:PAS domain S-box-containing protein